MLLLAAVGRPMCAAGGAGMNRPRGAVDDVTFPTALVGNDAADGRPEMSECDVIGRAVILHNDVIPLVELSLIWNF
jgi:hypothetical protein